MSRCCRHPVHAVMAPLGSTPAELPLTQKWRTQAGRYEQTGYIYVLLVFMLTSFSQYLADPELCVITSATDDHCHGLHQRTTSKTTGLPMTMPQMASKMVTRIWGVRFPQPVQCLRHRTGEIWVEPLHSA